MSAADPHALLDLAVRAAQAAGALLVDRFHRPASGIELKSSQTDPVSDADRDAEQLIADLLHDERPGDGVLGEEGAGTTGASGLGWVVDPLDGTVNFLYGIPQWAVSIACHDTEGTLVAVVHDPLHGETFSALRGDGTACNGRPLRLGPAPPLEQALVGTGFSYLASERRLQAELFVRVLPRARDIRRAGSAALDLAWVAAGRLDAFYEHGLKEWDHAAGDLLVSEAGGLVRALPASGGLRSGVLAGPPGLVAELEPLLVAEVLA
ncbi:MAG TPA: inositol monophosphatase family protein [Gaiellales bacterium]|nr:inositol monophosphatase family protein [Gaiellales bacterium]